eukprot:jgi/Mesvir1/22424/Mv17900-RA.1
MASSLTLAVYSAPCPSAVGVGSKRTARQHVPAACVNREQTFLGCRLKNPQSLHLAVSSTRKAGFTLTTRAQTESVDNVVVGGGISGLCISQAFKFEHSNTVKSVLVTEARERAGGNLTSVEKDGYLWEEGPNSFQPGDPILKMTVDVGLKDELVLGDPDAPRFVWWEGKLRPVPAGPLDLPVFDLMSIPGKLRAGLGAFGIRPPPPGYEESVEEFVRRNLGAEVFERLIEPFCSGVYAGDPTKLSMKAAFGRVQRLEELGGSIIGGVFALIKEKKANPPPPRDERLPKPKGQTVGSFRKGLSTLSNRIASLLGDKLKLNWKLDKIEKAPGGKGYVLTYSTPSGPATVNAKTVILTTPSYVAAELLRPLAPKAADALETFYYPPVAAVTIAYPKSAVREDRLNAKGDLPGFGQLHPRSQGLTILGTIYSSSLFPGRCPPGEVMFLNYIGGAQNTSITKMSEQELVDLADRELRKMLIKTDAPKAKKVGIRVWPRAIPQFNKGHLEALDKAKAGLKEAGLDGIFLGGNYVHGVALGKCVEGAYDNAKEVAEHLK